MKSKYRELLFILVLTGLALLALAWPTQKTLRTVAEAQGMWWSDCPGAPFCSPVSPLPSPTPRPTR